MTKPDNHEYIEPLDIADLIYTVPQLREAFARDALDGTLSSGEHAMTVIVQALGTQAQRLDASQLSSLSKLVCEYTKHISALENAAYRRLGY